MVSFPTPSPPFPVSPLRASKEKGRGGTLGEERKKEKRRKKGRPKKKKKKQNKKKQQTYS